jgi:hypothetical protein
VVLLLLLLPAAAAASDGPPLTPILLSLVGGYSDIAISLTVPVWRFVWHDGGIRPFQRVDTTSEDGAGRSRKGES